MWKSQDGQTGMDIQRNNDGIQLSIIYSLYAPFLCCLLHGQFHSSVYFSEYYVSTKKKLLKKKKSPSILEYGS